VGVCVVGVGGAPPQPLIQHLVRDRHLTEDELRAIAKQLRDRNAK
jgi:hypothetical protein